MKSETFSGRPSSPYERLLSAPGCIPRGRRRDLTASLHITGVEDEQEQPPPDAMQHTDSTEASLEGPPRLAAAYQDPMALEVVSELCRQLKILRVALLQAAEERRKKPLNRLSRRVYSGGPRHKQKVSTTLIQRYKALKQRQIRRS